jgi:hypothetical protein
VCNMQQNSILCFLAVYGPKCIPTIILVKDLNIWFHKDLLSLIFK